MEYNKHQAKLTLKERGFEQALFDKNSFARGNYQFFLLENTFILIYRNGTDKKAVLFNQPKSTMDEFFSSIPKPKVKALVSNYYKYKGLIDLCSMRYTDKQAIVYRKGVIIDFLNISQDKTPEFLQEFVAFRTKCKSEYGLAVNAQKIGIVNKAFLASLEKFKSVDF